MGKPYITREGYDLLHEELDYLWLEKRPDVTQKFLGLQVSAIVLKMPIINIISVAGAN